jgi:hypothetical protein
VVTSNLPPQLSNASDFSRASIEARIRAGYQDAMQQGIGDVDAPVWVPETRAMSCDVLIFVEEAADAVASVDLADPGRCTVGKWP